MKLTATAVFVLGLLGANAYAAEKQASSIHLSQTQTNMPQTQSPQTQPQTQSPQTQPNLPPTQSATSPPPSLEVKNKMTGDAFLTENKMKPGVVTLPDGLQYKIITQGTGATPTDADTVTVNYAGTLIDGTEFDSSYKRGQPVTFPVTGVIPGWTEALKLMKEGSTWEIYIPSTLAYGERGVPPVIGPNETLIFKVDLIKVNKQ
jgi:FKBP-type peptidyl-prolyl cis-trans isomerase